jgi:hypothetical protein
LCRRGDVRLRGRPFTTPGPGEGNVSNTVSRTRECLRGGAERLEGAASPESHADARDRLERKRPRYRRPVRPSVRLRCEGEPSDPRVGRVDHGTDHADEAAACGETSALHVDRLRSGPSCNLRPLCGVIHDTADVADHEGPGTGKVKRLAFPEYVALLVHDPGRGDERTGRQPGDERPGEAEADQISFGQRQTGSDPDQRRPCSSAPRYPLFGS